MTAHFFLLLLKLKCFPGHKCLLCTENALATALCNRHMRCCEVLPEMNLGEVLATVSVNWLITIANTDIKNGRFRATSIEYS